MNHKNPNELVNESSPYLLQHAYNPVNWLPWSDKAFEKAKSENKLVLVSVGYSACHWCHVMERETFEDSTAAAFMNKHFICIKVDREERPDVDQIYMNAVQLMTQRGGWPLNCFTLSDGRPIYGGTYFPRDQWMNVLQSLVDLKENEPDKMEEYAQRLTNGIQQSELIPKVKAKDAFSSNGMDELVKAWKNSWDLNKGGPNRAPKFPLPNNYQFLLDYGFLKDDDECRDFVRLTLREMSFGGIYDHVGGGFARYSVDAKWKIPHFEKMLYDNAQLISLYSEASKAYNDDWFAFIAKQSIDFCNRELLSPEGGYYSALDADSEGEEGKFYVWKEEELLDVLGDDYPFASKFFEINRKGLWEHGNYVLITSQTPLELANSEQMDENQVKEHLAQIRKKLLDAREERVRPGLDNKLLCSWNAMMIKALCKAYAAFGDESYLEQARKTAAFVKSKMTHQGGALFRNYNNGKANINAYLDDYAFLIEAFIELYQITLDENWVMDARQFTDYCFDHFYDQSTGMFYYTSDVDPPLIARKQELMDNVIPASNSVMANNLFLLGTLLDREYYLKTSAQMLSNILPNMDYGQSFSNWGLCHLKWSHPFFEIAVTGKKAQAFRQELMVNYIPNSVVLGAEDKSTLPLLEGKFLDTTTVFVCVDKSCKLPVNKVHEALIQINEY